MRTRRLSPARIAAAVREIDPVFLNTPQFHDEQFSRRHGTDIVVKVETLNPIGSFKGRGTWLLSENVDPSLTWVCSTAGNFGQGLAYAARAKGARVHAFVSPRVPAAKVARMRSLGADVETADQPEAAAQEYSAAGPGRVLVVDGVGTEMAEGAGTIGVELAAAGAFDTVLVQVGDGSLISGVAAWLKHAAPTTRVIGVCASGAPAMAQSFAARRPVRTAGTDTIATALAISSPIPESLERMLALVDDIVLVDDDALRTAQRTIAESFGLLVEPAGAAGVAALQQHRERLAVGRVALLLTGADQR
jgi:threonine dehydratase